MKSLSLKIFPQKGFTLIELGIVITVMAIITLTMLASFRVGDRNKRVYLASDTIMSAIRQAQNYSVSGKQIPSQLTPISGTRCGTDNSATIYLLGMNSTQGYVSVIARDKCNAVFEIDRFNLPANTRIRTGGIVVNGCNPTNCSVNPVAASIIFTPPFGGMSLAIGASIYSFSYIDVTVEDNTASKNRTLRVDGVSGRITEL
jgi:prepilin-type N-terminal cleavage/methylation domain-containing protein